MRSNKDSVATSGCFDILHAGHIDMLEKAAHMRKHLTVFLNTDESIARLKGKYRPIVPYAERERVLKALRCVHQVIPLHDDTPCELILEHRPDLFVKGADYRGKDIPEMASLNSYGGLMLYVDILHDTSSTKIINAIIDRALYL